MTSISRNAPFSFARPLVILRLESLALLIAAVILYARLGGSWWSFALLLFAPDVAMLGYAWGARAGAVLYNLTHNAVIPIFLALLGHAWGQETTLQLALVWLAHIGVDRALGYGLKSSSGFQDTHLGRIGTHADRT